jgi:hypothetical protein
MQTLRENQINYLVFPSESIDTSFGNTYVILIHETLTNNELYDNFATGSITKQNNRWITVESFVTGSQTSDLGKLWAKPGLTYELDFRVGATPYYTWIEAYPEWIQAQGTWVQNGLSSDMIEANTIRIGQDRVFISGSVPPNKKLYVTSNEDASFVIYQG